MCKTDKKRGFTVSIVSATVVIMIMLIGTISVVGVTSVNAANFEEYMSLLYRIKAATYDYIMFNETYPTTGEIVSSSEFSDELADEVSDNGDENAKFYVIDIAKIGIPTNYGKGTLENEDVFLVSSTTNNVYYLAGKKYKGVVYYGAE